MDEMVYLARYNTVWQHKTTGDVIGRELKPTKDKPFESYRQITDSEAAEIKKAKSKTPANKTGQVFDTVKPDVASEMFSQPTARK